MNDEIIEYMLICTSRQDVFENLVNAHIKEGWEPLGGVSLGNHHNNITYSQAMVKYKNNP